MARPLVEKLFFAASLRGDAKKNSRLIRGEGGLDITVPPFFLDVGPFREHKQRSIINYKLLMLNELI